MCSGAGSDNVDVGCLDPMLDRLLAVEVAGLPDSALAADFESDPRRWPPSTPPGARTSRAHRLHPVAGRGLGNRRGQVVAHRALGEEQPAGDVAHRRAVAGGDQHVALAPGQRAESTGEVAAARDGATVSDIAGRLFL